MHPMRFGGFAGIFGSVLIVLALVRGAGGVWLMALGGSVRRRAGLALAVALVATALPMLASLFIDRHAIDGALPPSRGAMSAAGEAVRGVPPG